MIIKTLYSSKKTFFLVALFSIGSVAPFISPLKAESNQTIADPYAPPPRSVLHERVQMILKSKQGEFKTIEKYYRYATPWSELIVLICTTLAISAVVAFVIYKFFAKEMPGVALSNVPSTLWAQHKSFLLFLAFGAFFLISLLYLVKMAYWAVSHPGGVFLTDTGVLIIPSNYNVKHVFVRYEDIKKVEPSSYEGGLFVKARLESFEIKFVPDFYKYEAKGVQYTGNVKSVEITRTNIPNQASNISSFDDLYQDLLKINKKVREAAMREKAKEKAAQTEAKSLAKIQEETTAFTSSIEDISEELYGKIAIIQARMPNMYHQIEAYYSTGVVPFYTVLLVEMAAITIFALLLVTLSYTESEFYQRLVIKLLGISTVFIMLFAYAAYVLYDLFMHPGGIFIMDTGFLYVKAGKKLQYVFVRYEDVKELLRDANEELLLVNSKQSAYDLDTRVDKDMPHKHEIECGYMKKEVVDTLYKHLCLKLAAYKKRKNKVK